MPDEPRDDGRQASSGSRRPVHVGMSPAEMADYLAAPRTMILATNGVGGFPHQAAMFYVMAGTNPVFWSYRRAQKVVNIERDPKVSCLVEEGRDYRALRGVMLRGSARVCADPEIIEQTWRQLTEKYTGPISEAELANFRRQADKRCVVIVEVTRVSSWDHRKLPPGRH